MAVNSTAIWRVRPSGSNTNGGGYDPGIAGAGVDYSQQNAAQASGTAGTATGTTTFTDVVANNFPNAPGNALYITGTGFTTGWYFMVSWNSSSSIVLDRSPGTGTVGTWHLGGGWADYWTNYGGASNPVVGGNTIYVLGSGTPNPSSYAYDYTQSTTLAIPDFGTVITANDPATPGYKQWPDTTGGMPVIKANVSGNLIQSTLGSINRFQGLWFVSNQTGMTVANIGNGGSGGGTISLEGCVHDQFSFDSGFVFCATTASPLSASVNMIGCEAFSSAAGSLVTFQAVANVSQGVLFIIGCNFHDVIASGIIFNGAGFVTCEDTIIAKVRGQGGCFIFGSDAYLIKNCTFDACNGDAIQITTGAFNVYSARVLNNIFSNNNGYGINANLGSNSDSFKLFFDFNTFYTNASGDLNNLSYGPHDTHGGSNPYVNQPTENYTLA